MAVGATRLLRGGLPFAVAFATPDQQSFGPVSIGCDLRPTICGMMALGLDAEMAHALVGLLVLYIVAGVLFAVPFVLVGVGRIDPSARGGTWGFRLIILPGVVALWPILAVRWLTGKLPPGERNAHRDRARGAAS